VDAIRFVNQFTTGHGDYTRQRDALFGHLTLDEILTAIKKRRGGNEPGTNATSPTGANEVAMLVVPNGIDRRDQTKE
jgi:hypothetical protein